MSPDSFGLGSVRPAAVVNELIRALWRRSGSTLTAVERREYELLVVEWAAATRAEVVKAA